MKTNNMTLQEAIHIAAEEAVRCRRLAEALAEDPMDCDGKCAEWARVYREKAEALEIVVEAARGVTDEHPRHHDNGKGV